MNVKIAVVGTVGIPACYGGFESLVENLTTYKSENINYKVFCSKKAYSKTVASYNGAELIYLPLQANGIQSIPYDVLALVKCIWLKLDAVLVLGVSGGLFLPIFRLFSSAKVITNIDGLEWKRDKWGLWAKRFLKWSESVAVKYSDIVITDNKAIGDYVEAEYGKSTITIAYGGDHALRNIEASNEDSDYALGLCRIEPENNVKMILEAFSQTDRHLKFIGNWNSSQFGRELRKKYSKASNIELLDPIYDIDELCRLRKGCVLYIHGHSAGGTNPSLVEMMHFGVPIFAYDCSFNRYSTENKGHYFKHSTQLIELLSRTKEVQLQENGNNMREIAARRYTWVEINRLYEMTYQIS